MIKWWDDIIKLWNEVTEMCMCVYISVYNVCITMHEFSFVFLSSYLQYGVMTVFEAWIEGFKIGI